MLVRKDNLPNPIDTYVGARMRLRRIEMRLSQNALAEKLGITFQAVQKYESSAVRLSASRLYEVAQALAIQPSFFFEGYADEGGGDGPQSLDRRDLTALLRGYCGIRDAALQTQVRRLISMLGRSPDAPTEP
jgi:transcriptional regulator with XRE-family HTH domain